MLYCVADYRLQTVKINAVLRCMQTSFICSSLVTLSMVNPEVPIHDDTIKYLNIPVFHSLPWPCLRYDLPVNYLYINAPSLIFAMFICSIVIYVYRPV